MFYHSRCWASCFRQQSGQPGSRTPLWTTFKPPKLESGGWRSPLSPALHLSGALVFSGSGNLSQNLHTFFGLYRNSTDCHTFLLILCYIILIFQFILVVFFLLYAYSFFYWESAACAVWRPTLSQNAVVPGCSCLFDSMKITLYPLAWQGSVIIWALSLPKSQGIYMNVSMLHWSIYWQWWGEIYPVDQSDLKYFYHKV